MVLGLIGGVGSGKSTVTDILNNKYGFLILKTDDIAKELESYSCAVIAASEYFTEFFRANCGEKLRLAVLNNYNICCGEGICGACCDSGGNKMCKCCGIQGGF